MDRKLIFCLILLLVGGMFVAAAEIIDLKEKVFISPDLAEKYKAPLLHDKIYNESLEKIEIYKKLSLKDKVAEYQLLENNCTNGGRHCEAIIKTNFYKKNKLFDSLDILKIIEGNYFEGRVRSMNIWIYTAGTFRNETFINSSFNNITNKTFYFEEIRNIELPEWSIYNGQELIGEHTWKIVAEKSPHHTLDWILEVIGMDVPLTEWALWYGDGGETWQNVTLNSPVNEYFSLSSEVDFSCSAYNNETSIFNISLQFWESDNWVLKNSSSPLSSQSQVFYDTTTYGIGKSTTWYTLSTYNFDGTIQDGYFDLQNTGGASYPAYGRFKYNYLNGSSLYSSPQVTGVDVGWYYDYFVTNPFPNELLSSIEFQGQQPVYCGGSCAGYAKNIRLEGSNLTSDINFGD